MQTIDQIGDGGTLVVVFTAGTHYDGAYVKTTKAVISALRESAQATLGLIDRGGGATYNPDAEQDDSPYLNLNMQDIADVELLHELRRGADLPLALETDLTKRHIVAHALVVEDSNGDRWVFVKRYSPIKMVGKRMISYLDNSLRPIEGPLFVFDDRFDVAISPTDGWALAQNHFEALFKESEAVLAHVSEWVKDLAASVKMTKDSKALLEERLRASSVVRRKVSSIQRRGHLSNVTTAQIKAALPRFNLDVAECMPGNKLRLTMSNVLPVLQLLNEDLFEGSLTSEPFAAGRKVPR